MDHRQHISLSTYHGMNDYSLNYPKLKLSYSYSALKIKHFDVLTHLNILRNSNLNDVFGPGLGINYVPFKKRKFFLSASYNLYFQPMKPREQTYYYYYLKNGQMFETGFGNQLVLNPKLELDMGIGYAYSKMISTYTQNANEYKKIDLTNKIYVRFGLTF